MSWNFQRMSYNPNYSTYNQAPPSYNHPPLGYNCALPAYNHTPTAYNCAQPHLTAILTFLIKGVVLWLWKLCMRSWVTKRIRLHSAWSCVMSPCLQVLSYHPVCKCYPTTLFASVVLPPCLQVLSYHPASKCCPINLFASVFLQPCWQWFPITLDPIDILSPVSKCCPAKCC